MHKLVILGGLAIGAYLLLKPPSATGVGGVPYSGRPLVPSPPPYLPPGWLGLGPPSSAAWRAQRAASGRR